MFFSMFIFKTLIMGIPKMQYKEIYFKREFMDSLDHDNPADVIEAFNSTSMYLGDHFEH